jgi:hypothetical protein
VDADVSVVDIDSPNLASATVTLTNGDPLGSLRFNGPTPGSILVFGSGTHQITLSGAASAADYQTALHQITYNNTGTNPSTETRVVDIVVNDGAGNSNTAQALIQVEVVNNSAPVLDLDANDSSGSVQGNFHNAFTENGAPVPIADVDTSITDAESATLFSATIKLADPQTGCSRSAGCCPERSLRLPTIPLPASSRSPVWPRWVNTKPRCIRFATATPATIRSRETASSRSWSTTGRTPAIW